MKKHDFKKLLVESNVRTPSGYLATLFRKILSDNDLTDRILDLITKTKYANFTSGKIINISKNRDNAFSDSMSIKVFMDLLRDVLQIKKIKLSVTLYHEEEGKEVSTTHDIDVVLEK